MGGTTAVSEENSAFAEELAAGGTQVLNSVSNLIQGIQNVNAMTATVHEKVIVLEQVGIALSGQSAELNGMVAVLKQTLAKYRV